MATIAPAWSLPVCSESTEGARTTGILLARSTAARQRSEPLRHRDAFLRARAHRASQSIPGAAAVAAQARREKKTSRYPMRPTRSIRYTIYRRSSDSTGRSRTLGISAKPRCAICSIRSDGRTKSSATSATTYRITWCGRETADRAVWADSQKCSAGKLEERYKEGLIRSGLV